MTLAELLRAGLHEHADRMVALPDSDAMAKELDKHDREKLARRVAGAVVALVIAALLTWQLAHSAPQARHVRIDHKGGRHALVTPAPVPSPDRHDIRTVGTVRVDPHLVPQSPAAPTHNLSPMRPTGPNSPNGSTARGMRSTPTTTPARGQQPSTPASSTAAPDFWALTGEVHDQNGHALIVVFGNAPVGSTVTMQSTLGTHRWLMHDRGGFRFTTDIANAPANPIDVQLTCDPCGTLQLRIDRIDPSPSQLGPQDGFSAFFAPQDGGFTFGGFDALKGSNSVQMSWAGGAHTFDVKQGQWGGRLQFPAGKSFTVTLQAGSATATFQVAT